MAADGKGGATPKRHSGGEKHGGHKKGHQQQHSGGGGSKPFHKKPKFQQDRGTKRGAGAGNGGDGEGPANKVRSPVSRCSAFHSSDRLIDSHTHTLFFSILPNRSGA